MRDYSLGGLMFASSARTNIPVTPVVGVPYRNASITSQVAGDGWPFSTVVDSADFNEVMYRVTSLLGFIERTGAILWSDKTNYSIGDLCRDDELTFWQAVQATGPGNGGAVSPTESTPQWKKATFNFYGGGDKIVFTTANYNAIAGEYVFCRNGGVTVFLPISPKDKDRVRVATAGNVTSASPVIIGGTNLYQVGCTSITVRVGCSTVELIYDAANTVWRISTAVMGGNTIVAGQDVLFLPPLNSVIDSWSIDLDDSNQRLAANIRQKPQGAIGVDSAGVFVNISQDTNNSLRIKDGGLYVGQIDEETIWYMQKQNMFFDGFGHIDLGLLDIGNWDKSKTWPLIWDFGTIEKYGPSIVLAYAPIPENGEDALTYYPDPRAVGEFELVAGFGQYTNIQGSMTGGDGRIWKKKNAGGKNIVLFFNGDGSYDSSWAGRWIVQEIKQDGVRETIAGCDPNTGTTILNSWWVAKNTATGNFTHSADLTASFVSTHNDQEDNVQEFVDFGEWSDEE